jgi:simple sugar transport system ATP-binding protein
MSLISSAKIGSTIVEMVNITKRFPGVVANDHVNFDLRKGEVHCLLGENGAGKTVLMSVLYGLQKPESGEIRVCGQKTKIESPQDAIRLGVGMVHQRLALVDVFTGTENVVLGLKSSREPFLDVDQAESKVVEISKRYGLSVNPKALIKDISVGERQRIELLKVLYRNCQVMILDEPTSLLAPQETDALFGVLRVMVDQGLSIVFITHKMREALAIGDRITVLRQGRNVATVNAREVDRNKLAVMMVGRETITQFPKRMNTKGQSALELRDVWALRDEKVHALRGVSFSLNYGEILGIAGVAGNGQKEIVECIFGLRKVEKGQICLAGDDLTNAPTRKIIERGVSWVPDDARRGVIFPFSVAENFVLKKYYTPEFSKGIMLNEKAINTFATELVSEYEIKTPTVTAYLGSLSGGNIQRLIVARELSFVPRLIVAENPTQGLDVKLTEFVQRRLVEQRDAGAAVLLVSMDLDEILALSDRIAVVYGGQVVGTVDAEKAERSKLGLMMAGDVHEYHV